MTHQARKGGEGLVLRRCGVPNFDHAFPAREDQPEGVAERERAHNIAMREGSEHFEV